MRPKRTASRRTKNRFAENPQLQPVSVIDPEKRVHVRNIDGLGKSLLCEDRHTEWLGWLPVDDLTDLDKDVKGAMNG